MNESPVGSHSRSTLLSIGFHVIIVVLLVVGVRCAGDPLYPPAAESVAIQATVVDESLIESELARIEEQEQAEILLRQQEEAEAREQAEAARRELEEQQRQLETARQEQQRREQEAQAEQARLVELQRQREEAERQQLAEEQRLARLREEEEQRRLEEERRQREQAEQRQREEQERLAREAEEARQRAQMEAELQRVMAAEEDRRRAEEAGLLDQYRRLIQSRVEQNWIPPATAGPGLRCEVNVTQIPSGDVIAVQVGRCNGDAAVIRSIEQAVQRASPLPQPPTPSLFSRSLELIFEPDA
ncbi:MAG TPA: cell envelope integrity protein TolA [Gammaproteobacteria bacterium]|jgi:colicin import membrane protein